MAVQAAVFVGAACHGVPSGPLDRTGSTTAVIARDRPRCRADVLQEAFVGGVDGATEELVVVSTASGRSHRTSSRAGFPRCWYWSRVWRSRDSPRPGIGRHVTRRAVAYAWWDL